MTHYAYFRGFVLTANPDGSIPLSSRMVLDLRPECTGSRVELLNLESLIAQANAAAELADALAAVETWLNSGLAVETVLKMLGEMKRARSLA